ncbi:PBECR4 domain-containing protein [Vagococcus carniphilus]|uniref:PBECR4 domain-containing protein n=1 Tax=Vagococcus carniphilus TaxID=218144 RepID=UPI00288E12D9|nr:PBECR4 domain-containing protein [Vagococcus carniphilus]MDT2830279.1 PBECR4 domain-containing protein [Vagococcus carniphilus]MDT2838711.1 PBECR4 domain-containing protein [Vagococcus carniphilus]MDT2853549.1 PBECR4 domain-containing protein [Vagococcus carniphilus]
MLTKEEFNTVEENPQITDISLKMLLDFYKEYLVPYKCIMCLENGCEIELEFPLERFPHLVGIEQVARHSMGTRRFYEEFKDMNGVEGVENEEITLRSLRQLSKNKFNSNKDKIVFFFLLSKIVKISNGDIIVEYNSTQRPYIQDTNYLIYEESHKAIGHLGLKYSEDSRMYYPNTFLVERKTINTDGLSIILADGNNLLGVVSCKLLLKE